MRASYNSSMSLRPLHDRILVRRIEEGERIRGGIVIPDTAKEKPQQGEVIASGGQIIDQVVAFRVSFRD